MATVSFAETLGSPQSSTKPEAKEEASSTALGNSVQITNYSCNIDPVFAELSLMPPVEASVSIAVFYYVVI
jgi:hypothetical protein